MTKSGRSKSESVVELNRKVRSDCIGINDRFGSEYAVAGTGRQITPRYPVSLSVTAPTGWLVIEAKAGAAGDHKLSLTCTFTDNPAS
ncbi:Uncharacterised protein [Cedecea neteri]|uniref:Uncharacterized protein n=1 Tax=Cedecea neteri TaxID=158822 RepID=A0A2X3IZR2_9ENTR|nr:Uncharacterised protein [Cedecea neteri]